MHQFSIKVTFGMEIDKNLKGHALAFTANVMWGLMSQIGIDRVLGTFGNHLSHGRGGSSFLDTFRFL